MNIVQIAMVRHRWAPDRLIRALALWAAVSADDDVADDVVVADDDDDDWQVYNCHHLFYCAPLPYDWLAHDSMHQIIFSNAASAA